MVVRHIPTVPGRVESTVPEPGGIRHAPHAPQVPAPPSHGEAVAVVRWGAAAGGNLAAGLTGLLTETALRAEGRCQRLRQPRLLHLGTTFLSFPAVFTPAFALVSSGKPQPHGHGTPTVPPKGPPKGCKARPWIWRMSQGFLAP